MLFSAANLPSNGVIRQSPPHLIYPQILDDTIPEQRELGLTLGYHLLAACSEMWVCGERISDGMAKEIHHAERLGINIRYIRKIEES